MALSSVAKYGRLEHWLSRGAQPKAEEYEWLVDQGVRILVNARTREDTSVEKVAPRLISIHIPVKDHHAPSMEQARNWLHVCDLAKNKSHLYVHCKSGEGRSSTFCIIARLAEGWPLSRAIDEQRPFGFDPDKEPDQAAFLSTFLQSSGRV